MSSYFERWDFVSSNDKLMLLGLFLFLIGGFGVATAIIPLDIGFITALAGLLMYTAAMFTLSRQVDLLVKSSGSKR